MIPQHRPQHCGCLLLRDSLLGFERCHCIFRETEVAPGCSCSSGVGIRTGLTRGTDTAQFVLVFEVTVSSIKRRPILPMTISTEEKMGDDHAVTFFLLHELVNL